MREALIRLCRERPEMTLRQLAALVVVAQIGPVRIGELADVIGAPHSATSRAVSRLVEAGLVRRIGVPGDARGTMVGLTADGFRLWGSWGGDSERTGRPGLVWLAQPSAGQDAGP